MNISVLDCTLRDGGYCNNWEFGLDSEKRIIAGLVESGVEIVECGFLTNRVHYKEGTSKFTSLSQIKNILPQNRRNCKFVVMVNYGEYNLEKLPERNDSGIDGIRIAFHKKDASQALREAEVIKEKGYDLFLQPMVSLLYSDSEFLKLIFDSNNLNPYAFYIVDSFGNMKKRDLERYFFNADHNLDSDICIGFHSHNNLQLSFSNAQALADSHCSHDMVIDSCIYGMGRGGGNLNTELFLNYLNENYDKKYEIRPIVRIIDKSIDGFFKRNSWGYSLTNYLSAIYNTHPNYSNFLIDKNTLNIEEIDSVLKMMKDEKRVYYDEEYIENLYLEFLSSGKVFEKHRNEFENTVQKKRVMLIAPGKSSYDKRELIEQYAKNNDLVVISVNHDYSYYSVDYIFLSNLRRYREIDSAYYSKCIVTSNIPVKDAYMQTDYHALLNENTYVRDNAGLMAIKFLVGFGVNEIILAGFDGYSHDYNENYADQSLLMITKNAMIDAMNAGMSNAIKKFSEHIKLYFLTNSKFVTEQSNDIIEI